MPGDSAADRYALGVDLGTSNTVAVMRWPDGRTRPLLFDGVPLLPSAVFLDQGGKLHVGRDAQRLAPGDPSRFEPNPKRRIDEENVLLGTVEVPVVDLLAAVLTVVGQAAVEAAGFLPPAALTYPAAWGTNRRQLLTEAATRAGWTDVRLVPEPVAAARHFTDVLRRPIPVGASVAVFDFGAGTLDIAVVRRERTSFEVLATGGLEDLGGLDMDQALVTHLGGVVTETSVAAWNRLDRPGTVAEKRDRNRFWEDVRGAKEMLSRSSEAPVAVPGVDQAVPLTRTEFDRVADPLLRRAVDETARVLDAAGLKPTDLAGLFLVGGSSRIPLVARLLHGELGVQPTALEQPELPVAEGAVAELDGAPAPASIASVSGPPAAATSVPPVTSAPPASAVGPIGYGQTAYQPAPTVHSGPPTPALPTAPLSGPPASPFSGPPASPAAAYPGSPAEAPGYPGSPAAGYLGSPAPGYPGSAPTSGYPGSPAAPGYPGSPAAAGYPVVGYPGGQASGYPGSPAAGQPGGMHHAPPAGPPKNKKNQRLTIILAAALVLVVVLGIGAWIFWPKTTEVSFRPLGAATLVPTGDEGANGDGRTAVTDDRAYYAWRSDDKVKVLATDLESKEKIGPVTLGDGSTVESVTATDAAVYVIARAASGSDRVLFAVNPETLEAYWNRPLDSEDRYVVYPDSIALIRDDGQLEVIGAEDNAVRWQTGDYKGAVFIAEWRDSDESAPGRLNGGTTAVAKDRRILALGEAGISVLDPAGAREVRKVPAKFPSTAEYLALNGKLYVAGNESQGLEVVEYTIDTDSAPSTIYMASGGSNYPIALAPCGVGVCLTSYELSDSSTMTVTALAADGSGKARWTQKLPKAETLSPVGDALMVISSSSDQHVWILDNQGTVAYEQKDRLAVRVAPGSVLLISGYGSSTANLSLAGLTLDDQAVTQLGPTDKVDADGCSWSATVLACPQDEALAWWRFADE